MDLSQESRTKSLNKRKKESNNKKEVEESMPKVKGHYRRISRVRRVRVTSHRRSNPSRRLISKKAIRKFFGG